jgi:hypothetical protein
MVVSRDGGEQGIDRLENFGAGGKLGLRAVAVPNAGGESDEERAEDGED